MEQNLPIYVKTTESFNVWERRLRCYLFDAAFLSQPLMVAGRRLKPCSS